MRINTFSWVRNHVSDKGVIILQETHSTKDLGHHNYIVRTSAIRMGRAMPKEC